MIRSLEDLDFDKKSVFVRVDFNVPLANDTIVESHRIDSTLPTLKYLLRERAQRIILASHLGRPQGQRDEQWSLRPVARYLDSLLAEPVAFLTEPVGVPLAHRVQETPNRLILLENLRFNAGEEANDPEFARSLAHLADVYVNDAFGTAHRAHASTVGMVRNFSQRGAGFLFKKEVDYFARVLNNPTRPFTAILGGAKVSDKIGVIRNLIPMVNRLIIGGAMAYTFLSAKGIAIGKSLVEQDFIPLAAELMKQAENSDVALSLPIDHVASLGRDDTDHLIHCDDSIPGGYVGLDIGPKTAAVFSAQVKDANLIIWNGPLGLFETTEFSHGTMAIARALSQANATTVIAGGDTVAAVTQAGVAPKMTHLSTGGGATLELLEGKKLPGVEALESDYGTTRPRDHGTTK
jgi:phosphoglycerate kinase